MKKLIIATTLALTAFAATPALARDHFNISLGFAAPAPVTYYQPAPVYYQPTPVVYYPPRHNVYYAPPRPYAYGYGHRPHHRERVYVDAWNAPRGYYDNGRGHGWR